MCIGIPSKVLSLNGQMAEVDSAGEIKHVSLILMDEEVKVGDYLLIQVGNFAVEVIDPERAESALTYMQELVEELQHGR